MRVLLVGCGNPLRSDDSVGWRVVEKLARRWAQRVSIRVGQQLLPEWAADLAAADVAFIVDASSNRKTHITPVRMDPPLVAGHVFGPSQLVGLTQHVYARSPVTYLVEVPAAQFDFGEPLSPASNAAASEAIALLDCCLTALMRTAEVSESGAPPAPACMCGAPPRQ